LFQDVGVISLRMVGCEIWAKFTERISNVCTPQLKNLKG